jgi:hypothetical protein
MSPISGGELALFEAADDFHHSFREAAILSGVLVHQFAGDAAELRGFANERLLQIRLGHHLGSEIIGEAWIGDVPKTDRGRQAGDMNMLLKHISDLARIAAMVEAFVLGDHLRCQPQESCRPFHLRREIEDRGVGREVAIDLDEGPGEALEVEPFVFAFAGDQLAHGIGRRFLVQPFKPHSALLSAIARMCFAQVVS